MDFTYEITWYIIETHVYVFLNCWVLFVLITSGRNPGYNLTANLFVAIIAVLEFRMILVLDYFNVIDIKGPRLCGVQAFFKKLLIGVVPLSLCGIAYERVKSLPRIYHVKCLFPAWKVLLLTWGISGILSCHRFLAYEYFVINKDYNNGSEIIGNSSELRSLGDGDSNDSSAIIYHASVCRKTPLFNNLWVNALYEFVIFGLLHVSPALYTIYALHKIGFKVSYICLNKKLKQTLGRRLYRDLRRIRLAFIYTTVFALIWIPYGVVIVLRSFTENSKAIVVNYKLGSPGKKLQTWFEGLFNSFHPIFYVYTHHHSRFITFFRVCKRRFRRRQQNIPHGQEPGAVSTIALETFEASS